MQYNIDTISEGIPIKFWSIYCPPFGNLSPTYDEYIEETLYFKSRKHASEMLQELVLQRMTPLSLKHLKDAGDWRVISGFIEKFSDILWHLKIKYTRIPVNDKYWFKVKEYDSSKIKHILIHDK